MKTTHKLSAAGLIVALGIIYGDIGTSPLYVMKAIVGDRPISQLLVYGSISCVFWTLTFQTTFKYILLTLSADNHGEGGVFSLYALVRRFGKGRLVIPTILGATTLLADGIITPPISVASAVEGLDIVVADLPTIPIVLAILTGLFFFQRYGTQKVGTFFGPIMALWFGMLLALGIVQVVTHPQILTALNPVYAYELLTAYPSGFWLLGAVFLCTTGAEALYSDLGHCGRQNIRVSWIFVKIALVVNYLGQAAWLMEGAGRQLDGRNPFFSIMPDWLLLPGILLATAAAVIASQALISGSYTLINEAISLNFWPRVTVRNPTDFKGQIYIPSINVILWIGCILMVLYFKTSAHMEAAYGFSITVAMLMTTFLLGYYLLYIRKMNTAAIVGILLVFVVIEIAFFTANVVKIKERWMFLFFELFIFTVMYVWYFARKTNNRFLRFVNLREQAPMLERLSQDESVPKYATHLVYLSKADRNYEIEEKIIRSILSKRPKRADMYWFLHINRVNEPYALDYEIVPVTGTMVVKIVINVGFRIQPRVELYFRQVMRDMALRKEFDLHLRANGSTPYCNEPDYRFVIIEKYLSNANDLSLSDRLLMNGYYILKKLSVSEAKAFGLDRSDVVVERMPFVYQPITETPLQRITKPFEQ